MGLPVTFAKSIPILEKLRGDFEPKSEGRQQRMILSLR